MMETDCCIVGAGPAGAMLALLLVRQGVRVTLLEAHENFDRDFRGDTLHPSALEVLDQLDLADTLLELPHEKVHEAVVQTKRERRVVADFRRLRTAFPYIALMPQDRFLAFITGQAARHEGFELIMGANARELLRDGSQVVGVEFEQADGTQAIKAQLVVACDGRFSRMRKQSELPVRTTSPPMDVLWFRVPRRQAEAAEQLTLRVGRGHILVVLPREDHDQLGYVILKGSFREVRAEGLAEFKRGVVELAPHLEGAIDALEDWKQITPLAVESNCLERWHLPGLLFIGDAAHVMSPVGGVGINYAIQDAVATANRIGPKLREGSIAEGDLAAVQRRRQFPTRVIQRFQACVQRRIIQVALDPNRSFRIPRFLSFPVIRRLPARLIAYGIRRERVRHTGAGG